MSNVQLGDRVQWSHTWYPWEERELITGTIIGSFFSAGGEYAWISVEHEQSPLCARMNKLIKLPAQEAPSVFERVADDYYQLMQIGDLGGCEL